MKFLLNFFADFFFSSPIGRVPFLARFIGATLALVLAASFGNLYALYDSGVVPDLGYYVSWRGPVIVLAGVYLVRYAVLGRLLSIRFSLWQGLFLLLPLTIAATQYLSAHGAWTTLCYDFAVLQAAVFLVYFLGLGMLPEGAGQSPNVLQALVHDFEAGEGAIIIPIVPLTVAILLVALLYNVVVYRGLDDPQSMDNAQLARQIALGRGYTTEFIRPYALRQLRDYATSQSYATGGSGELFPAEQFPRGAPRVLPDTYNAPVYPCLLALYFKIVQPNFAQSVPEINAHHMYIGDRLIPPVNFVFLVLTAGLVFVLGLRLFDWRVAWMAMGCFVVSDLVWQYTLTALSTNLLMFLITGAVLCTVEIFEIGVACFESEEETFDRAWLWAGLLIVLLVAACLTRLHLVVLLLPLTVLLCLMPRASYWLAALVALATLAGLLPWFWHMYHVSGNPLGSNAALLLLGEPGTTGDQIYRGNVAVHLDSLFRDTTDKEFTGFRWHFQHAWELLGYSPLILLFAAAVLHPFKRLRILALYWLLLGSAVVLIAANNLGVDKPENLGAWNNLILLFPTMLVIGAAFFFIQIDRLNLMQPLVIKLIVVVTLVLSAAPMLFSLTESGAKIYSFPPYIPPILRYVAQLAHPDEWVTADLPWATAWYGDRASLWLPDSAAEFQNLYTTVCPSGVMLLTPETWEKPASNLRSAEDADWLPFALPGKLTLPSNFPLTAPLAPGAGAGEYVIWSDHPRWQDAQ